MIVTVDLDSFWVGLITGYVALFVLGLVIGVVRNLRSRK
jgi:hypothetical protein